MGEKRSHDVSVAAGGSAVLDAPVWHALTGAHAALADVAGGARRYPAEVGSFGAWAPGVPAAWVDLVRLAAMAGERLRPPGRTESSAVCTDSAFQGQGLARSSCSR